MKFIWDSINMCTKKTSVATTQESWFVGNNKNNNSIQAIQVMYELCGLLRLLKCE